MRDAAIVVTKAQRLRGQRQGNTPRHSVPLCLYMRPKQAEADGFQTETRRNLEPSQLLEDYAYVLNFR